MSETQEYICDRCDYKCATKDTLKRHKERKFPCEDKYSKLELEQKENDANEMKQQIKDLVRMNVELNAKIDILLMKFLTPVSVPLVPALVPDTDASISVLAPKKSKQKKVKNSVIDNALVIDETINNNSIDV